MSEEDTRPTCIMCATPLMSEHVTVCHACQKYQKRWKNSLNYWAGITGIFALVAGAVSFGVRQYIEIKDASTPKLVISSIDFKYAEKGRENRILLFNGHASPVLLKNLYLWHESGKYQSGPTFELEGIIPPNSLKEIFSPPFRDNETAGERWSFPPGDYRAGVIQSMDTNWTRRKSGWKSERWENGDPIFVDANVSYVVQGRHMRTSVTVWQGFSHANGKFWR